MKIAALVIATLCSFVVFNSTSVMAQQCNFPCFEDRAETPKQSYSKKRNKQRERQTSDSRSASDGLASFYWQPQQVASGGRFNPNALTAAHKTLPFGTRVEVTNNRNGRSVVVTINDRGPYVKGRVIDLSKAAAQQIGMTRSGVVPVSLRVL